MDINIVVQELKLILSKSSWLSVILYTYTSYSLLILMTVYEIGRSGCLYWAKKNMALSGFHSNTEWNSHCIDTDMYI